MHACSMAKCKRGGLPRGVMRREGTRELVCDVRFTHGSVRGKFHATQIESLEAGAFFYDIVKLYEKRMMMSCARRRPRLLQLNYPEQSLHLHLPDLPPGFHIKKNKDQAQKLILDQARRAARDLIHTQSRANTQSTGISSDTVFGDRVFQEFREKACKVLNHCWDQYLSKASERQNLERMVAGISEAPGIISLPNSRPEKFYECVAFIKRIIKRDGELFPQLEKFEQTYKSEESKCWELRKGLEDHNLKSISESLIGNQVGKEVEVSHVIRSIAERLVESPKDVLRNPWVSLFFSPDSSGSGAWDSELENLSKILNNNSPTWNF